MRGPVCMDCKQYDSNSGCKLTTWVCYNKDLFIPSKTAIEVRAMEAQLEYELWKMEQQQINGF